MLVIQFYSMEKKLIIQFHSMEKRLVTLFSVNFMDKKTGEKAHFLILEYRKLACYKISYYAILLYSLKLYERV